MTVREYIGARYVPLFMGEWDNTATYEPLSIVQYQGNSYTSRQFVPAGIAIDNTVYWANTGNYNAQVEAYRQEVQQYNDRISAVENGLPVADFDAENTVKDAIDAVTEKLPGADFDAENTVKKYVDDSIVDVETALTGLYAKLPATSFDAENTVKDAIDDMSTDITNLASRVPGFKNANILCVIDSWGNEGAHSTTKCWPRLVCEALGANCILLNKGGTGFCNESSQGANDTYLVRVQEYVAAHPDTRIDYLFVCGSQNDWKYTYSEIGNAITAFYNWVGTNIPNAVSYHFNVFLGADPVCCTSAPSNPNYNIWTRTVIGNATAFYGTNFKKVVYVWQLSYTLVGLPSVMDDFGHPSQNGHNVLAKTVLSALFGGSSPVSKEHTAIDSFRLGYGIGSIDSDMTYISASANSCNITGNRFRMAYWFGIPSYPTISALSDLKIVSTKLVNCFNTAALQNIGTAIFVNRSDGSFLGVANVTFHPNDKTYTSGTNNPGGYFTFDSQQATAIVNAIKAGVVEIVMNIDMQMMYSASY